MTPLDSLKEEYSFSESINQRRQECLKALKVPVCVFDGFSEC